MGLKKYTELKQAIADAKKNYLKECEVDEVAKVSNQLRRSVLEFLDIIVQLFDNNTNSIGDEKRAAILTVSALVVIEVLEKDKGYWTNRLLERLKVALDLGEIKDNTFAEFSSKNLSPSDITLAIKLSEPFLETLFYKKNPDNDTVFIENNFVSKIDAHPYFNPNKLLTMISQLKIKQQDIIEEKSKQNVEEKSSAWSIFTSKELSRNTNVVSEALKKAG